MVCQTPLKKHVLVYLLQQTFSKLNANCRSALLCTHTVLPCTEGGVKFRGRLGLSMQTFLRHPQIRRARKSRNVRKPTKEVLLSPRSLGLMSPERPSTEKVNQGQAPAGLSQVGQRDGNSLVSAVNVPLL